MKKIVTLLQGIGNMQKGARHLLIFLLLPAFAQALTCTSGVGVRNWTTIGSWSCGRIPTNVDDVVIPSGSTVTLTIAGPSITSLNVQNGGALTFSFVGAPVMPVVSGTKTFGATSTVTYGGNGTQIVSAETYGNLVLNRTTGNRTRTPASGTINILGNFTIDTNTTWAANTNNPTVNISGNITVNGTLTSGTGVYTFNGTTTQTISATVTITNVTISNTTTSGLSLAAAQTFTNITMNANAVLSIAGTTTAFPTNTTLTANSTSTVKYVGTGAQVVAAKNYGNLLIDATGQTKTPAAGTHNVSGNLTLTTGTIWAGNTNNPTVSVTGNLDISGTFTSGTGAHTVGINLNLNAGATLNLGRTGTAMPTVTGTKNFNATSTVNYTLNGNQAIAPATYGNLTLSGGGNKTPDAGTFTIAGTYNLAAGTWVGTTNNPTINFAGNITRVGTFTSGSGMHTFNGTGTQTISAAIVITNATITNTSTNGLSLDLAHTFTNLTMGASSVLSIAGTTTAFPTNTTFTANATSTVQYTGTGAQVVAVKNYGNLTVNANLTTKTPAAGTIGIAGNFTIGTGTTWAGNTNNPVLNIAGNIVRTGTFTSGTGMHTFNGTTTQTISAVVTITNVTVTNVTTNGLSLDLAHTFTNLTVSAGAVLTLAGTTTAFPTNTTRSLASTSNVRFMGSGAQAIPAYTYGNLETGVGGNKTPATGTLTLAGSLTVGASSTWVGTTNNPTVNIAANFTNAGTFNSGTGIYTFNSTTAAQTLTGATTFSRLTLNNTAAAPNKVLSLSNDLTVGTTLNFTSGNILTNANKVIIPSGATVTGAAAGTGWVVGNLQRFIAAGSSTVAFDVGTNGAASPSLAYTPVSFSFTGVSGAGGSFIVSSTQGDHPQVATAGLDTTKLVSRWWEATTTGVIGVALPAFTDYSVTLNFLAADLDVGVDTTKLFVNRYSGSWTAPTTGTRTATSTQATGLTALGQYAIGHADPVSITKLSAVISDPISGVTNPKRIPGAILEYTITVTAPGTFVGSYGSVLVTDTLASGMTYNAGTLIVNGASEDDDATNGGTSNPDVGNYNLGSKLFTIDFGTMTAGSSESFKFRVTVD